MATATKDKVKKTVNEDKVEERKRMRLQEKQDKAKKEIEETKTIVKAKQEDYSPTAGSQRHFVMRALKKGGTADEIKARAARLADKAGITKYANVKSYSGFNIAFFAKLLKEKGMKVTVDEENDNYQLKN